MSGVLVISVFKKSFKYLRIFFQVMLHKLNLLIYRVQNKRKTGCLWNNVCCLAYSTSYFVVKNKFWTRKSKKIPHGFRNNNNLEKTKQKRIINSTNRVWPVLPQFFESFCKCARKLPCYCNTPAYCLGLTWQWHVLLESHSLVNTFLSFYQWQKYLPVIIPISGTIKVLI